MALIAALLVAGCAGGPSVAEELSGWTRSANFTTCTQWLDDMTDGQREVMARDLLPTMRTQVDTAADDGASLAPAFAEAIGDACHKPDVAADPEYVVTAAAVLAFLEDARFQP